MNLAEVHRLFVGPRSRFKRCPATCIGDPTVEDIKIGVTGLQSVLDCPRCFWLSYNGLAPPEFPPPGILSRMDSVIKRFMERFVGRSDLPGWFPVRGEFLGPTKTLEVAEPRSGVTVSGRLDALVRSKEGYHIVDYKTASPKEEVPEYYQTQLDGYAYLLEGNGYRPVAGGVLLYFMPEHGDLTEGRVPFEITPVRAEVDPGRIPRILSRARRILEMVSPPPPSKDCEMCEWWREIREALSEL